MGNRPGQQLCIFDNNHVWYIQQRLRSLRCNKCSSIFINFLPWVVIHIFMNYIFNLWWIKLPVSGEVTQAVEAMLPSSTGSSDSQKTEVQQQAGKSVSALPGPRHCILMEPITGLKCDIWGAGDRSVSFFEETLTQHCSASDTQVAPPGFLTSH